MGVNFYSPSLDILTASTMLLRLPPELRLEIYRLLLLFESPLAPCCATSGPQAVLLPRAVKPGSNSSKVTRVFLRDRLTLLSTCRQLLNEGSSVFYGENEFVFTYRRWEGRYQECINFIGGIGSLGRSLLSKVTVFGTYESRFDTGSDSAIQDMISLIGYLRDSPGLNTKAFEIYCCCPFEIGSDPTTYSCYATENIGLKLEKLERPNQSITACYLPQWHVSSIVDSEVKDHRRGSELKGRNERVVGGSTIRLNDFFWGR